MNRACQTGVLCLALTLLLGASMPASAAVVILKSGERKEGKLIRADDNEIVLETFEGEITILRRDVKTFKKNTKSGYERYLAALKRAKKDVRGHLKLADICIKAGAWAKALEHLNAAKKLDPESRAVAQRLAKLRRAREDQEIARAQASNTPLRIIPRRQGRWLIQGSDRKYYVEVPASVAGNTPLPLVLVYHWRVTTGAAGIRGVLDAWRGFAGVVVTAIDKYSPDRASIMEVHARATQALPIDTKAVMIVGWRARAAQFVAELPNLLQYAFDDSTFGGKRSYAWPSPPNLSADQKALVAKAHIRMYLTGKNYKAADHGFDDAKLARVQNYWKALGVTDVTIDRYPEGRKFPSPDYSCIGQRCGRRARAWFEGKLKTR